MRDAHATRSSAKWEVGFILFLNLDIYKDTRPRPYATGITRRHQCGPASNKNVIVRALTILPYY